jgi:hypothetical protein
VRGGEGKREGEGDRGEEMAQTIYAHMNKWIKEKKSWAEQKNYKKNLGGQPKLENVRWDKMVRIKRIQTNELYFMNAFGF